MKLWQKDNTTSSALIEQFTVGRDREFDMLLAKYDVQGSLAHTQMLNKVGLLDAADYAAVKAGLEQIATEIAAGDFAIDESVEDIHSQVEFLLTERVGEAGKKIHSGRSRNDQVAVDLKLYLRDAVLSLKDKSKQLFDILQSLSEQHKSVLLPGYTHLQIAMPSSFGLWFGAYAESLIDDLELLAAAYHVANKNPLGSGAGYGSSFPLNRTLTTGLLGFEAPNYNAVYAQMTRGKTERTIAMAIAALAGTLGRMAMDICLYINQNFGFISFPTELTTGSSIMPHKKNPDVFELIRGKCSRIQACPNELTMLLNNLPSGYHRDLQLTKEILFPALNDLEACFDMYIFSLPQISLKDRILDDPKYKYLFTVEALNELVNKGVSFRDAYVQVGNNVENGKFDFSHFEPSSHTHEGSMGNLCTAEVKGLMDKVLAKF